MALALRLPLFIVIVALGTNLPQPTALAAGLDAEGKATLKEATRLYKQGLYEEAAKLLTELAVDHAEMTNLQRNLGACYYYMRRPEPALSNLRDYLAHKKDDITADDKQEVERWIDEMEKLRAQNATAISAVEVPPAAPGVPAAVLPAPEAVAVSPVLVPAPVTAPAQVTAPAPVIGLPAPAPTPETPAALNVSTQPASSESPAEAPPVYKRWWFWGTVGAVVAAGAVTAVVLFAGKGGSNVPGTPLGNQGIFQ